MIKFFRKIRQNLLSEGKTGRYFKYAIGEIILVVIGILIALQINNWNESNKLKKEETLYLKRLKTDLEKDTLYYNNNIDRANLLIDRNFTFLKKLYDEQKSIDEGRELMNLHYGILNTSLFKTILIANSLVLENSILFLIQL